MKKIPESLLVIGGGYIGLEMGTVFSALGSSVSVAEFLPNLLPGADPDLVKPLARKLKKEFDEIHLSTKITKGTTGLLFGEGNCNDFIGSTIQEIDNAYIKKGDKI